MNEKFKSLKLNFLFNLIKNYQFILFKKFMKYYNRKQEKKQKLAVPKKCFIKKNWHFWLKLKVWSIIVNTGFDRATIVFYPGNLLRLAIGKDTFDPIATFFLSFFFV